MTIFIFCSCAGCLIRYVNIYKDENIVNWIYLILDLFIAAFTGFLLFNLMKDYNITTNQGLVLATICGNLGSRGLYIFKHLAQQILKFNIYLEGNNNGDTRNKKP